MVVVLLALNIHACVVWFTILLMPFETSSNVTIYAHADSCLPDQMLPFMLILILVFLIKCVFITILKNKKVQFASLFRLSCLLAENLLIFEKVRFCHEISSILSPRTYKLLFNGLTNSKSFFCIFTAIISAFC